MKDHKLLGALAFVILSLCLVGISKAQTPPPGTRVTPCDPATPNNAVCVAGTAPIVNEDGTPTVLPLIYRVERKLGIGTFTTIASNLSSPTYYDKGLAPGDYTYRMYANCTGNAGCTESNASNSGIHTTTPAAIVPKPPAILVVKVTISADAPVYRVIGANGSPARGEMYGLVPAGRECEGPVLFRYRGKSFRLVHADAAELWGTSDAGRLAAPCS